jgi:protocatechuate 3,4-dioxygenase beta subunit
MTRRRRTPAAVALLATLVLAGCGVSQPSALPVGTASPTDTAAASSNPAASAVGGACTAPAAATIAQVEGPYFKAGSPERSALVEAGMAGTPLTFTGFVVDTGCDPIAGAVVDIWQADASGAYDNSGYRLRGHVATDANGRFAFETIIPGEYPGRTEHIHVKVTPPGGSTLTTQMYFPGVAANDRDGIFNPSLVLSLTSAGDGYVGSFTFVIAAS